jgi:hypothetical protein
MSSSQRTALGDFQTPPALAQQAVDVLSSLRPHFGSILEPTAGRGSFVSAAHKVFGNVPIFAFDINPTYVQDTLDLRLHSEARISCTVANFFDEDWNAILDQLPEPILVVGNPPWVTSAGLGALSSSNAPKKSNFQQLSGLDALTGRSNFDIAEWILLRLLKAGQSKDCTLGMLVKTSVARRVLAHLWRSGTPTELAMLLRFDATKHFGVSADACLFVCRLGATGIAECTVGDLDRPGEVVERFGWRVNGLVADLPTYDSKRHLLSERHGTGPRWRSGVKHDCSPVMELVRVESNTYTNGRGDVVELEPDYIFPLLKGTDLNHNHTENPRRWMLVTQTRPGDETTDIAIRAPRTWAYLLANAATLDERKSSIYRARPRFAVFGVGAYTFAPWKIAISALHKRLAFRVIAPIAGRPVVLDDTCYSLSFDNRRDAEVIGSLLDSQPARELLNAQIFWDAKRPVTIDILQRLDLQKVASELGLLQQCEHLFQAPEFASAQLRLGEAGTQRGGF